MKKIRRFFIFRIVCEIFQYLRRPFYFFNYKGSFIANLRDVLLIYLTLVFLNIIAVLFIEIVNILAANPIQRLYSVNNTTINLYLLFFKICFLNAIYEELAFRLFLKFSPVKLSISISLLVYFLLSKFLQFEIYSLNVYVYGSIILFFMFTLFLNIKSIIEYTRNIIIKYFKHFFYISIILFAILHIVQFEITFRSIFFIPIIILPQLIAGVFFGFVRMKYGIMWSIVLHVVNNSIPFLALIILLLLKN